MGTDLAAELLEQIEATRERVDKARRLARGLAASDPAATSLRAYGDELEAELQKLEAQAAVLKQAAEQDAETDPQHAIAALKPPPDPEPEAEK